MIVTDLARIPRDVTVVAGAFDPIHPGHLAYFREAAAFGSPLCCGVASDTYIRSKGRRPLLPQADRVQVLDALTLLTYVVAEDEMGDAGLLYAIRPQLYVKSQDWADRLPEAERFTCAQYGIPIRFVARLEPYASSAILHAYQT